MISDLDNTPSLAVFMLDYNASDLTIKSIKSVLKSDFKNLKIYLLMNGSKKKHIENINNEFIGVSEVTIYTSENNLGFTGGNNYILNKIIDNKVIPDVVLLLNNDAYVENNTISHLITDLMSNPIVGIVGPRILKSETDIIESDGGKLCFPLMQQSFRNAGKRISTCAYPDSYEVPFVSGACMMIRTELFIKLNGFDDKLFAYFEDLDLCLRAKKIGYFCMHISTSCVSHIGSVTSKKNSFIYHYLLTRNRCLIASKHLSPIVFIIIFIPYFFISRVLYKTIALFLGRSFAGIKGIVFALLWLISPIKLKSNFLVIGNKS